jgi:hypothetical protein
LAAYRPCLQKNFKKNEKKVAFALPKNYISSVGRFLPGDASPFAGGLDGLVSGEESRFTALVVQKIGFWGCVPVCRCRLAR